ncbi:MAG: ATP synthase F0 subunit B [Candidatus Sumerlaeia bacterium]|nr:ATP synthase F0 subunit B [Candidatus Sumerlaeia bacterium]
MIEPVALLAAAGLEQLLAQVITTIVTFVLVLITLKLAFWKPVLETLDQRKNLVTQQFEEIDSRLAKAKALQAEYESKLASIQNEAREIQNKAIEEAKRIATELESNARAEAEAMLAKAKSDLSIEVEKARIQVRQEAIELTLQATGKLLKHEMNDSRQRELVAGFIADLQNQPKNGMSA